MFYDFSPAKKSDFILKSLFEIKSLSDISTRTFLFVLPPKFACFHHWLKNRHKLTTELQCEFPGFTLAHGIANTFYKIN